MKIEIELTEDTVLDKITEVYEDMFNSRVESFSHENKSINKIIDDTSLMLTTRSNGEEKIIWVKGFGLVDSDNEYEADSSTETMSIDKSNEHIQNIINKLEERGLEVEFRYLLNSEYLKVDNDEEGISFPIENNRIMHLPLSAENDIVVRILEMFDIEVDIGIEVCSPEVSDDSSTNEDTDNSCDLKDKLLDVILVLERNKIYAGVEKDNYLVCHFGEGEHEITVSFRAAITDPACDPMIHLTRGSQVYTELLRNTYKIVSHIQRTIVEEYIKSGGFSAK